MSTAQFHLAFGVRDLEEARAFYIGTIGCKPGRETIGYHENAANLARLARPRRGEAEGRRSALPTAEPPGISHPRKS